jgi:hypothetical protein
MQEDARVSEAGETVQRHRRHPNAPRGGRANCLAQPQSLHQAVLWSHKTTQSSTDNQLMRSSMCLNLILKLLSSPQSRQSGKLFLQSWGVWIPQTQTPPRIHCGTLYKKVLCGPSLSTGGRD